MRVPFNRRAAIAVSIVAIAMAPLAACSSDDDSSSESSTTKASSSETTSAAASTTAAAAAADEATTKAITDAYVTFFNGQGDPAARTALVENAESLGPALQGMTTNPQSAGTSATVTAVTMVDDTHANVTWTLNINGAPMMPDQTGQAVYEDGTWKVATSTVCGLLAIAGGGGPIPGC